MKIKQKPTILNNGVSISHTNVSLIENANKSSVPYLNYVMLVLLQMLTGVGAIMTLSSILSFNINSVWVYAVVAVSSVLYTFAYKYLCPKYNFKFWYVFVASLVLTGLLFLITHGSGFQGVKYLVDQGHTTICKYMYFDLPELSYEWTDELQRHTNLVIALFAFLYMAFISYFIVVKVNFLAIFLLTFPCFEIGAAFGCVPNYYYFATLLASWAAAVAMHQANNIKSRKASESNKKKRTRVFSSNYIRFAGSSFLIAVIFFGVFVGSRFVLNNIGLGRTEDVEQLRTMFKSEADSLWDYVMGEDKDGSMKDGQLLKVDDHHIKNRHHLTMETSLQEIQQPLYLRGFSGTLYDGIGWRQIENYKNYRSLFNKLEKKEFMPQEIANNLLYTTDDYDKYVATHITLSDFRRKKDYGYYLYNSGFDDSYGFIKDYSIKPYNEKEYGFDAFLSMEYLFDIDKSQIYHSDYFKKIQKEYSAFVKKEYTASYKPEKVVKIVKGFDYKNKYALVDRVRDYLRTNIKYTYIVDKSPADVDFVENLLFETKRGYSTHFASAAAVMLQSAGVPTRYVEGYCVLPKVFNKIETTHKYGYITVDVTDAYAHAWVEIYDSNFGWIPVDVTPTYYSGSFEEYMKQFINLDSPQYKEEIVEEEIPQEEPTPTPEVEGGEEEYEEEVEGGGTNYFEIQLSTFVIICIVAGLLLIVLLILIAIPVSYYISKRRLNKRLNKGTPESRIYNAYLYILKVATACGVDVNVDTFSALQKNLCERFESIDETESAMAISCITKSGFSEFGATDEDADCVVNFARKYAETVLESLKPHKESKIRRFFRRMSSKCAESKKKCSNRFKAFVFKYIKHLG